MTNKVLNHLRKYGSISAREAEDTYRCRSLSKRICEIKEFLVGSDEVITRELKKDALGQRYARYSLVEAQ